MSRITRDPLMLAAIAFLAASPAGAAPATIRTGGPSFEDDAKRAVVLAKRPPPGKALHGDRRLRRGGPRGDAHARPAESPGAYAGIADLSAIMTPGDVPVARRPAQRRSRGWSWTTAPATQPRCATSCASSR